MRRYPTVAIEALLDLAPLYLVIDSTAKRIAFRMIKEGVMRHRSQSSEIDQTPGSKPIEICAGIIG